MDPAADAVVDAGAVVRPPRIRHRRMSAPAPRAARPRLPCRPLTQSLEALDLSSASPIEQVLASLRFLVLSYLADLERRISLFGEASSATLELLHTIRAEVRSHLPDLHLPDVKGLVASIDFARPLSYVPTLSARLKSLHAHLAAEFPSIDAFVAHARPSFDFRRPSFDFHRPSFEFHRPSFDFDFDFDFPRPSAPPVLRDMYAAFRVDVDAFLAELPSLSLPGLHTLDAALDALPAFLADFPPPLAHASKDAPHPGPPDGFPTAADALAKADYGRRLINYDDLPFDWRNNPFVVSGYRFIPLSHWPRLPLSLLTLHNETLNIHTHLVPLLAWGAAFAGVDLGPVPVWLRPLAPWLEWLAYPVGNWGRYTPFAAWSSASSFSSSASSFSSSASSLSSSASSLSSSAAAPAPDPAESLFTLFALLCLLSSALWHLMAGCAHKRSMETCARIDYVGIGWLIAVSVGTIVRWGYGCEGGPLLPPLALPPHMSPLVAQAAEVAQEGVGMGARGVVTRVLSALGGTLAMQSAFVGPLYLGAGLVERLASLLAPGAAYVRPALDFLLSLVPSLASFVPALDALTNTSLGSLASFASLVEYAVDSFASVSSTFASLSSTFASLSSTLSSSFASLSSIFATYLTTTPTYHPLGACCLALCAAAGLAGNVLPFWDWFNRVENRLWRLLFFVGISFSAVAPMAGIVVLRGWDVMAGFIGAFLLLPSVSCPSLLSFSSPSLPFPPSPLLSFPALLLLSFLPFSSTQLASYAHTRIVL
ncbi:hypothetical protein C8R45DRAFT_102903 [Mycena sanguinolenta]|nr:hypothetical protein C8R45DRAFT_102903 [Mycena sanguinolenta]